MGGAAQVNNEDRGPLDTEGKDSFEAAFEEAGKAAEPADVSAADDPAREAVAAPVVETPAVVAAPVAPVAAAPAADPAAQQPGESDEKYEQRYRTLQGIHKHDREIWEAEKIDLLAKIEEAKKPATPATPAETAKAEAFVESLTDEQKEQLAEYEKDFDVVSQMEGIKRSVELGKLRKEMLDTLATWKEEFVGKLTATESRIAPAVKLAEESDHEAHFSAIRNGYVREDGTTVPGHADFETYRDDGSLLKWIETRPRYLQPALKETYSKGEASDVIDLLSDFKRDQNIPLTPASDNVVRMNQKADRKQALTSVTSRRGAVNSAVAAANDFESAFEEAMHR